MKIQVSFSEVNSLGVSGVTWWTGSFGMLKKRAGLLECWWYRVQTPRSCPIFGCGFIASKQHHSLPMYSGVLEDW